MTKKKRFLILGGALLLAAGLCIGILALCGVFDKKEKESFLLSSEKADGDFSDLFAMAGRDDACLAHVQITKTESTHALIEKYDLADTDYTRLTARVITDYNGKISGEITIYLLGNETSFPSREVLTAGREYLLRLEPWMLEDGFVYLLSPVTSDYYRVHEGNIMIRQEGVYHLADSVEGFAQKYKDYLARHPLSADSQKQHLTEMLAKIEAFDYTADDLDAEFVQKNVRPEQRKDNIKALLNP